MGSERGRRHPARRVKSGKMKHHWVVWDVDLLSATVIVRKFTKAGGATEPVAAPKRGNVADAEPAAPGFSMNVDDLFE